MDTTGCLYDDFIRLIFLDDHREALVLTNELPEESDQFRFLRAECFANLKGSVGLIMVKSSVIRISIPLDLSSRSSFIPVSFHPFVSSHTAFNSFPRTLLVGWSIVRKPFRSPFTGEAMTSLSVCSPGVMFNIDNKEFLFFVLSYVLVSTDVFPQ